MTGTAPLIYVIAGEASGDALGAGMMAAISEQTAGQATFAGIGGPLMAEQGLASLFPMDDLAVMGLAEVLPRLPDLLKRMKEARTDILAKRPQVLVTIDSPDFCFRVAKKVKAARPDLPIVHYVAPTVWAWRPGRARAVARFLDHLLCLYPFEPPYFEVEGLAATFVGHPIAECPATQPGAEARAAAFRARLGLAPGDQVLAVLPGSRSGELDRHLDVFGETLTRLWADGWRGRIVVPTLTRHLDRIRAATAEWPGNAVAVTGDADKWGAFAAAAEQGGALAASGTVTLELAAAGVPSLVAYRVSGLSAAIAKRMIRVPHVGLVNILMKREVMPEFLQENCRADLLAPALAGLLNNTDARAAQQADCRAAMALLRAPEGNPAQSAARTVMGLIPAA